MGRVNDLNGLKFHKLTVIKPIGLNKHRKMVWLCKCDCGNETNVISAHLKNGNTKSCGCYHIQQTIKGSTTHGKKHTKLYGVWIKMKSRCKKPNDPMYKYYGNKGISVHDVWNDFENFYSWSIENGYSEGLSIDRIDSNGDYEPNNCRWADIKTQNNNKSNNVIIELNGIRKTLAEWSEYFGINYKLVKDRYHKGKQGFELFVSKQKA